MTGPMPQYHDVVHCATRKPPLGQPTSDTNCWHSPLDTCQAIAGQHGVSQTSTAMDCMHNLQEVDQSSLAKYFSTGAPQCLNMSVHNFQSYFRVAKRFNNDKLLHICSQFYFKHKVTLRQKLPGHDYDTLLQKYASTSNKMAGAKRKWTPDESRLCYKVLFLTRSTAKLGQKVTIVNVDEKYQIMQKTLDNATSNKLPPGFAACTMYSEECPYIVICGGHGKKGTSLRKFDVVENRWSRKSCKLNAKRLGHVVAYVNGSVYIVGGQDCAAVEVYHEGKNKCHIVGSLPVSASCMAYETHKDKLYVFGGKTWMGDVACVQCIDTTSNEVTRLPDLPCQCSGGQAVAMGDAIYIATDQGHMIKFSPSTGESVLCAHQPVQRKNFAIFTRHEHVYILGGVPANTCDVTPTDAAVSTLYKYSPDRDYWKPDIAFKKGLETSIYSSCTVRYAKKVAIYPFDYNTCS